MEKVKAYIESLRERAEALKGKRGVVKAREVLAKVKAAHAKHLGQLSNERWRRPDYLVALRREITERLSRMAPSDTLKRGHYGEILRPTVDGVTVDRWHRHPTVRWYFDAIGLVRAAQDKGLLPKEFQEWDDKGRGNGLTIDLYDCLPGLALVQVREVERVYRNGYLSVLKTYYVTDGEKVVTVNKHVIRRAIKATSGALGSALRAVRKNLPVAWQDLVPDDPVRYPTPASLAPKPAFKVLAIDEDGTLRSVYMPSVTYPIGKYRIERAKPGHLGGLYVFPTREAALKAVNEGTAFNANWIEDRKLVLARCTVKGRTIQYGSGKMAVSMVRVDEVLEEVTAQ